MSKICDCGAEVPPENEQRVCAYQVEPDCVPDYQGATFCDCCNMCRLQCHTALIEENKPLTAWENTKAGLSS